MIISGNDGTPAERVIHSSSAVRREGSEKCVADITGSVALHAMHGNKSSPAEAVLSFRARPLRHVVFDAEKAWNNSQVGASGALRARSNGVVGQETGYPGRGKSREPSRQVTARN